MKPSNAVPSGLYLILDHPSLGGRSVTDAASAAIEGGVRHIQYRAKDLGMRDAYLDAVRLRSLTERTGVTFLINDRVDLALAVEADGVHLGQEDLPLPLARSILGPNRIIGISAHTLEQARVAESGGADYLGIGPVFTSETKQARPPIGCEGLRRFRPQVRIPMIAIGGISPFNIHQVIATKVDGVAVVSAILSKPDLAAAAAELSKPFKESSRAAGR